jgi:hypothetical protein
MRTGTGWNGNLRYWRIDEIINPGNAPSLSALSQRQSRFPDRGGSPSYVDGVLGG